MTDLRAPLLSSNAVASQKRRVIHVQLDPGNANSLQAVSIFDGMSREDVAESLRSAAGLPEHHDFSLFGLDDGSLVPISTALPDGLHLVLRPIEEKTSKDIEVNVQAELDAKTPRTAMKESAQAMSAHTQAMKNFSKVSNYLANERTLLAWIRTSLAVTRTAFAVVALSATTGVWLSALNAVTVCLGFLSFAFFAVGYQRFKGVRYALDTGHPPDVFVQRLQGQTWEFCRPYAVAPVNGILGLTLLVLAVAAATKQFHK